MSRMSSSKWAYVHWFNASDVPFWEKLSEALILGIDAMATKLRRKPVFTSTWRSPEKNIQAGGKDKSQHLDGNAADVVFPGKPLEEVYQAAREVGFKGIGLYPEQNFIHVDTRQKPGTWARIHGVYTGITAGFDWLKKKRDLAT